MGNLFDKLSVSAPLTSHSLVSVFLLGLPCSLRHNREIRPINNHTMACKCLSERKSCASPTLNQKLEMVKLGEEGVLKAELG